MGISVSNNALATIRSWNCCNFWDDLVFHLQNFTFMKKKILFEFQANFFPFPGQFLVLPRSQWNKSCLEYQSWSKYTLSLIVYSARAEILSNNLSRKVSKNSKMLAKLNVSQIKICWVNFVIIFSMSQPDKSTLSSWF